MHSASARFNNITLFTAVVLAVMSLINFTHGYLIYTPNVDVHFNINNLSNFMNTKPWEQAAFKYSLQAG
jgi:dolichyl-phosphate-mannose--protein O-mannosyl transferase